MSPAAVRCHNRCLARLAIDWSKLAGSWGETGVTSPTHEKGKWRVRDGGRRSRQKVKRDEKWIKGNGPNWKVCTRGGYGGA